VHERRELIDCIRLAPLHVWSRPVKSASCFISADCSTVGRRRLHFQGWKSSCGIGGCPWRSCGAAQKERRDMRRTSWTHFCRGFASLTCASALTIVGCAGPTRPSTEGAQASGTGQTVAQSTGQPTPAELIGRGWTCFSPPVPNRIVCSHPQQGSPVFGNPPPADRPASYSLWLFDGAGNFVGTETLIRTDLYNSQTCESTGQPYILRAAIGYYECVHTTGS
jgi:hypothetical protein